MLTLMWLFKHLGLAHPQEALLTPTRLDAVVFDPAPFTAQQKRWSIAS